MDWELFKRVLKLASPFKKYFIIACVLAIVLSILAPIRPFLIQVSIDDYILQANSNGLLLMGAILVGILLVETLLRYNFVYLTNWLGQSVIKNLRTRVFDHILKFRLRYFDQTPIGKSTTRAISDVEVINNIFSQGLITIVADLLTIFMVMFLMFYSDWQLALVCLLPFPLFMYATYVFKEKVKVSFQTVRNKVSQLNSFLQERITGMSIVQIFSAEKKEMKKFVGINAELKKAHMRSIWYYSVYFPVMEVIQAMSLGLVVWFGTNLVLGNQTSLGVLVAFIMYLRMLFRPLRMIADKFNTLQMGLVASERVFQLLDREEKIDNSGKLEKERVEGAITFEKVWFAYDEKNFVLKNISFDLKAGQTLAIVGATGAGKSSVINILNRFYEIQKGTIKVDGLDIRKYDLYSLRSNIGLVLQDVFLFSGSIHDNITLRNPAITRATVKQAAEMVGASDFIEKLPNQYDYEVMERGATLSLGQRQLISFIRTLVFDPSILILDEATSSIDTETEMMVQYAVEKLVANRTSIVIAHRLSTIQHADKIMVLDKGNIMEIGSHKELLKLDGYYKKLYDTQFAVVEN